MGLDVFARCFNTYHGNRWGVGMLKRIFLGFLVLFTLSPLTSHAATVNADATNTFAESISGLEVGGYFYNATFHPGASFNDLYDLNSDGVLDSTPMFWGDRDTARAATQAIIDALSHTYKTAPGYDSDHFLVPYDFTVGVSIASVDVFLDYAGALTIDIIDQPYRQRHLVFLAYPYVTFESSPVPIPPAVWLFGSGLLGLIGFTKRKKAA